MNDTEVTIHDNQVALVKRKGSSALTEAKILGVEIKDSVQTIYLDRLVHKPFEDSLGDFKVSGAISSILKKPVTH